MRQLFKGENYIGRKQLKNRSFCWGYYSKEKSIPGRKLFAEIQYLLFKNLLSLLSIFSSNGKPEVLAVGNESVNLESPILNSTNTEDDGMSNNMAKLAYYATFIVVFQFGWASTQIAHLAAIPDLSECQNERTGLTAIRYSMTVISTIMVKIDSKKSLFGSVKATFCHIITYKN